MKKIAKASLALVLALIIATAPVVALAAPQTEGSANRTDIIAPGIFDVLEYLAERPLTPLTPEAMEMALYDFDYLTAMLLDVVPTQNIVERHLGISFEEYLGLLRSLIEDNVPMPSVLSFVDPDRWAEANDDDLYIAADFIFNLLFLIVVDLGGLGHMIPQERELIEQTFLQAVILMQYSDNLIGLLSDEELEFYLELYTLEEIEEYLELTLRPAMNFIYSQYNIYNTPSVLWFYQLDPTQFDLETDLGEAMGFRDEENITTEIIEEGYIAYLRIASFLGNMEFDSQTIFPFLEEIQDFGHLIIDIRGNGGGWTAYFGSLIVSMLIDEPLTFTSYEFFIASERTAALFEQPHSLLGGTLVDIVPAAQLVADRGMTEFNQDDLALLDYAIIWETTIFPAYNGFPFDGEIWLLVDGGSMSASDNAASLSLATGFATVVGSPTGGVTGVLYTYAALPNTGILFRMDLGYTVDPLGRSIEEFGVIPQLWTYGWNALDAALQVIEAGNLEQILEEGLADVNEQPVSSHPQLLVLPALPGTFEAQLAQEVSAVVNIDGEYFLGVRHMANVHGYTVEWNEYDETVTIVSRTDGSYRVIAVSTDGIINVDGTVLIPYDLANEMFTNPIVGTWIWDVMSDWAYTINNDGTGLRGFYDFLEVFTWSIVGNELDIVPVGLSIVFFADYDLWYVVMDGETMVLISRDMVSVLYSYTRA